MTLKNEKGSAFLEVLISVSVLTVILMSLIPSFAYVARTAVLTKQRTVSQNLAMKELENIKSLDYDQVGLTGGNPNGLLTPNKDVTKDGVSYHVKTRIRWQDDPDDGLTPSDRDPRDYKSASVQVTWTLKELSKTVSVATAITRQSEEQIATGGNIKVIVKDSSQLPVEDTKVNIATGPSSPVYDFTDSTGEVLFAMLDPSATEGDYSLTVEKEGYVVHPQMANLTTTVQNNETRILEFTIEQPGTLNIQLVDDETGQDITDPSHLSLSFSGAVNEFDSENGHFGNQSLFPGIWEIVASSSAYESSEPISIEIAKNEAQTQIIRLRKKRKGNMHLQVFDNATREAIPYATVGIINISTAERINTDTNTMGILEIQLVQATYDVHVSKPGYDTKVAGVVIDNPGNTHVDVYLNRTITKGSILVTAVGFDRVPKPDIQIRIRNGALTLTKRTDSNGVALFNNLDPVRYTVYRWWWGWRDARTVYVYNGIQSTVTYRY